VNRAPESQAEMSATEASVGTEGMVQMSPAALMGASVGAAVVMGGRVASTRESPRVEWLPLDARLAGAFTQVDAPVRLEIQRSVAWMERARSRVSAALRSEDALTLMAVTEALTAAFEALDRAGAFTLDDSVELVLTTAHAAQSLGVTPLKDSSPFDLRAAALEWEVIYLFRKGLHLEGLRKAFDGFNAYRDGRFIQLISRGASEFLGKEPEPSAELNRVDDRRPADSDDGPEFPSRIALAFHFWGRSLAWPLLATAEASGGSLPW